MTPTAVLIGPPAAGKSRLGRSVARLLEVPFVDTDSRVTAKHGPIPEIFDRHGEAQFREWEREEVANALSEDGIVSLGGGAIESEVTRRDLEPLTVVLVTVSEEAVAKRLSSGNRPLIDGIDSWKRIVSRRNEWYETLATITVDTSVGPMDLHAQRLATMLKAAT